MIITHHGRKRLLERMGCRKDKAEKVVLKAYKSREKIKSKTILARKFNGYDDVEFRMFSGCIFCFGKSQQKEPVLITVLNNPRPLPHCPDGVTYYRGVPKDLKKAILER
jgi:hypothetical protein